MIDDLATISLNKKSCTGSDLNYSRSLTLHPIVTSKDGFDSLVSEYYKFFREIIAADVAFLRGVERHSSIREFDGAVYKLRTAKQHDDNIESVAYYEKWIEKSGSWQSASDALARLLEGALVQLARISGRVRRDEVLARAWRDQISAESASVFDSVCSDLKVSFGTSRRNQLVRNVESRRKNIRVGENVRAAVESFCVEEVTNQPRGLPVPYYEILDRLDLIGRPQARAAILLAYSISASTSLRDEAFLNRVLDVWKVATA